MLIYKTNQITMIKKIKIYLINNIKNLKITILQMGKQLSKKILIKIIELFCNNKMKNNLLQSNYIIKRINLIK